MSRHLCRPDFYEPGLCSVGQARRNRSGFAVSPSVNRPPVDPQCVRHRLIGDTHIVQLRQQCRCPVLRFLALVIHFTYTSRISPATYQHGAGVHTRPFIHIVASGPYGFSSDLSPRWLGGAGGVLPSYMPMCPIPSVVFPPTFLIRGKKNPPQCRKYAKCVKLPYIGWKMAKSGTK